MFKLATLVAVTAASTAKEDEDKAKASLAKDEKTLKALMITGSSKVGKHFTMPEVGSKAPTWGETLNDSCWTCAFTWGTWTAGNGNKDGKDVTYSCVFCENHVGGMKGTAVTVKPDLTYEKLFTNLEGCAKWDSIKSVQALDATKFDATTNEVHGTGCASTWDPTKFIAGEDTGHKNQTPAIYSWDYTWDATSTGGWCYQRTVMPKTFKGGLLITHANDVDTAFAMKIDGTATTWFDNVSLKKQGIGKTGKVA